jgi:hypothetical protein
VSARVNKQFPAIRQHDIGRVITGEPFFAWCPSTVTSAPTGTSSWRHPRLYCVFGEPNSSAQDTTLPFGPFTSNVKPAVRMTYSIFVIVLFRVTGSRLYSDAYA